jgi:predicted transcriptional regulator
MPRLPGNETTEWLADNLGVEHRLRDASTGRGVTVTLVESYIKSSSGEVAGVDVKSDAWKGVQSMDAGQFREMVQSGRIQL